MKTASYMMIAIILASIVSCAHRQPALIPEPDTDHASLRTYLESRMDMLEGKNERAVEQLEEILVKDPNNFYLLTELSTLYYRQGKFKEAYQLIGKILAEDAAHTPTLLLKARLAVDKENFDEATSTLQKVLLSDPTNTQIRFYLVEIFVRQGNFDAALDQLDAIQKEDPDELKTYFIEAMIYAEHKNNPQKAIAAYRKFLVYEPDNIQVLLRIADLEIDSDQDQAAIKTLRRTLKLAPNEVSLNLKIALIHYQKGRFKESAAEFERIQKQHPNADKITYYLGVIYENTEQYVKAEGEFVKINPSSPFFRDAQLHRSLMREKKGERDEAILIIKETVKILPHEIPLYEYLTELYRRNKDWSAAIATLQQAIAQTDNKEKFYYSLGGIYDQTKQFENAIGAMEEVLKINPDNPDALNFIGYLYTERNIKLDKAEMMIAKAIKLKPNDGYIMDSMGWLYYQKGDHEKALFYLLKANSILQNEPVITEHIGDVYKKMSDHQKAKYYYQRALQIRKQDPSNYGDPQQIQNLENKLAD